MKAVTFMIHTYTFAANDFKENKRNITLGEVSGPDNRDGNGLRDEKLKKELYLRFGLDGFEFSHVVGRNVPLLFGGLATGQPPIALCVI